MMDIVRDSIFETGQRGQTQPLFQKLMKISIMKNRIVRKQRTFWTIFMMIIQFLLCMGYLWATGKNLIQILIYIKFKKIFKKILLFKNKNKINHSNLFEWINSD